MKKRGPVKGNSLASTLLWSYILHTLMFILTVLVALVVLVVFSVNLFLPQHQQIKRHEEILKRKAFDQLSPEKLGAGNQNFEIVDQDGQVLYSTLKNGDHHYQQEELDLFYKTDSYSFTYWESEKIRTKEGQQEYILRRLSEVDNPLPLGVEQPKIIHIRLDERLQVISSNVLPKGTDFSRLGQQILKGTTSFWKYQFVAEDGQKLILVLYNKISKRQVSRTESLANSGLFVFILVYLVLSFLFALRMRRKIYRPLTLLRQAIKGLTDKSNQQVVDYQGPAEFMEIVTDFNQVAQDLYQSEAERQKLQAERRRMLADISHDLKTPITVIQGYAKAVRDGLVSPSKQELYLDTIYQKSEKLNELIRSFHDYSKIEHPDFSLTLATVNLCELLRLYMVGHYAEFDLAGFHLVIDIPVEPIELELDRQQFERVLDNLLANFFTHNPKGSTLFVKLSQQAGAVELILADDGLGIPSDKAQNLFSPFVTGDEARGSQSGSGLGLAIVKKIVEAQGGRISLQYPAQPPYKTAFVITFPTA